MGKENYAVDPTALLALIRSGDAAAVDALAKAGSLEGFPEETKQLITRETARSGRCPMLRGLFERWHLYSAEPDETGRTPLHFAAMSGDADTVRFAMDVLGFDPLAGDARGCTALEEAARAENRAAYRFLTERLGFDLSRCYRNPILRGFHPDPSVLRVGENYYLVNSSFVFFPGLPVFHSRDLIHWQLIGHAVENLELSGLAGLRGGFGYWAPDISFWRGRFWVVATLRRDTPPYRLQMITSAADPRGPWDAPRFLPLDGIDPSLFADDDGRRYMLLNPGATLTELDENGNQVSDPEMIFFGSARIKPEGPHLLRKDGWYYLFLAEGGTGEGHMETVMRSRSLKGPYEACPFNPILSRKNPFSPVKRSGHGKPVSTPDGRWFMVYLCGRGVEGKTVMGRETALDPMSWTADGWPMVNRLRGPSCLQALPFPQAGTGAGGKPFGGVYNSEWVSPRSDAGTFAEFSSDGIRLSGGPDPAGRSPCSLLLRRQAEPRFSHAALADLSAAASGCFAGLTGYYDERSFFLFGLRKTEDGCLLELTEQIGDQRLIRLSRPLAGCSARLRVEGDGFGRSLFLGDEKVLDFRADYLCDEALSGFKRFTGALLGLFAVGPGRALFRDESFSFCPETFP